MWKEILNLLHSKRDEFLIVLPRAYRQSLLAAESLGQHSEAKALEDAGLTTNSFPSIGFSVQSPTFGKNRVTQLSNL